MSLCIYVKSHITISIFPSFVFAVYLSLGALQHPAQELGPVATFGMVRETVSPRKRPLDDNEGIATGSAKRYGVAYNVDDINRAKSPPKTVRWPSKLEQGPTRSRLDSKRSHSPEKATKSSLHAPDSGDQLQHELKKNLSPMGKVLQGALDKVNREGGPGPKLLPIANQTKSKVTHQGPRKDSTPSVRNLSGTGGHTDIDESVCAYMQDVRSNIISVTDLFEPMAQQGTAEFMEALLTPHNERLVRYVGCIAMGGPKGENGWHELFQDSDCMKGLVFGVIGRALKEHVFDALWFGASEAQEKKLLEWEIDHVQDEGKHRNEIWQRTMLTPLGFNRNRQRARFIETTCGSEGPDAERDLALAERKLLHQLVQLLSPMLMNGTGNDPRKLLSGRLSSCIRIAIRLSRTMRLHGEVIYYWPPTFKDEEFEPSRMEVLNLESMIKHSPYKKVKDSKGRDTAVLDRDQASKSEAIVRVVCFPGLVAYRQGGGDLGQEQLDAEQSRPDHAPPDVRQRRRMAGDNEKTVDDGFRTKTICKSVVCLQWGKQRLLTKEAGTSAHLDAMKNKEEGKYEDDSQGFVELYDLYLSYHPPSRRSGSPTTRTASGSSLFFFFKSPDRTSSANAQIDDIMDYERPSLRPTRIDRKKARVAT